MLIIVSPLTEPGHAREDAQVMGRQWLIVLCKQVSIKLFHEGGNRCFNAYTVKMSKSPIKPLGASKAKLWPKCLTDCRVKNRKRNSQVSCSQGHSVL